MRSYKDPLNYQLHISDGRSQKNRLLPALQKDYFNVSEMHFHTLLALLVDYAQVMKFYNLEHQVSGTWKQFFSSDETVVIATILSVDLKKLTVGSETSNTGNPIVNALRSIAYKEVGRHMIGTYTAIHLLDNWLQILSVSRNQVTTELHKVLESVIIGLRKDTEILWQYLAGHLGYREHQEVFSSDLIALTFSTEGESQIHRETSAVEITDTAPIRSSHYAFIKAIEMVQINAAKLLSSSLLSGDHDPAVGLLFAFLQLFQKLQKKLNRFTLNYVDFYYDQVLKVQQRDFSPDYVFLVITPNKKDYKGLISRGTEFLAKLDDEKLEAVYTATEDVSVNDAIVKSVYTLYFKRDAMNFPENDLLENVVLNDRSGESGRQLATACWLHDIPALPSTNIDQDTMPSYPLFGATRDGEENALAQQADIGFAFASKVLQLKEGRRTVTIEISFKHNGLTLGQWIQKIAAATHSGCGSSSATSTRIQEQQAFFKAFKDSFVISLSTKSGWQEVPEYLPSYSGVDSQQKPNSLRITVLLPESFPGIIAVNPDVHGADFGTELPVIRFLLNSRSYLYPYGIFCELEVSSVEIDVHVEGCRTLQLYNNIGQLSPLTPFAPFGPIPEVGSYLIAGCPETAGKHLSDFDIVIQWGGIPAALGGFKAYYQGYELSEDTDFRVSATVLANGKWLPENAGAATVSSLFQTNTGLDGGSEINEHSHLSCRSIISSWSPVEYRSSGIPYRYSPSTNKGFFKFTLIAPEQAFGHREYPKVLTEVLTFNAKQKHSQFLKKIPNPPYTPMIVSIFANYKAASKIIVGREETNCIPTMQEKIIHWHPLGWENAMVNVDRHIFLLPRYSYSGNLLIGLRGLMNGGVITLYFYLRENSLPIKNSYLKELQWFYMANNQWLPLSAKEILSDSTQRFMTSGIITLNIPMDITQENTVLPAGLSWLRASAEHELENFCSVYSIHAQAIMVSRQLGGTTQRHLIRLPPGAVTRARKSIPGIGSIKQIQASFGGKLTEDHNQLRVRISERLKHKKRALLPVDYELLILEKFPQVYKVKCFPSMAPDFVTTRQFSPGQLVIVALPYLSRDEMLMQQPFLSGHLINEIEGYIGELTTPFVTVHVGNPVYEVIQIRCTVKLKNPLLAGLHLNRLNTAISDFLSPWNETVGNTNHFGWSISKHDIESYIQSMSYIDRVTNLSILRIVPRGDDYFELFDSAERKEDDIESKDIAPIYPWSIVAPIGQHFIEVDDRFDLIEPEITGIGKLEIGSTFIISDEKWREKIEKH
ncbi:hypothetical protein [Nitrosomonas sp.]|uniref:hypothetical protein n=1 Tax=Nitrosomonas sp. TaxID=42353 RepID=UPI001D5AC2D3|nr:hypothetical protein [Nitrosomonas sp.]MBX3616331.1 hypothetical protein [Nitrosomonas sp.]